MAITPQQVSGWFQDAMNTFLAATRFSIAWPRQAMLCWSQAVGWPQEARSWEERAHHIATQAVTAMQNNADLYASAMDAHRQGLELLIRNLGTGGQSMHELQEHVQQTWQRTFDAMQASTQAFVQANTTAVRSWADLVHRAAQPQ